ncbi:MAG: hypothetical protein ACTSRC_12410 [Candidatus Helarchaeota archaeon]
MERNAFYKYFFLFIAIWNWAIGLSFVFLWPRFATQFGLTMPSTPIWIELFLWFVFIIGFGYFLVSRDLGSNHGLILVGLLMKVTVFIYFTYYLAVGEINLILFLMSVVDFVSACIMVEFLFHFQMVR